VSSAKRNCVSGERTFGSEGNGGTLHFGIEMLQSEAGVKLTHVPFKGAGPAVIDLVGGHVMLRFDQVTTSLPFIRAGKLRALGVSTSTRSPALPDVPTIAEALPGFYDSTFNGLLAPAGTPREVTERVRSEVAKAASVPELRTRFIEQGIEIVASNSTDEFAAFLRKQVEDFAVLARQAGITAN